MAADDKKRTRSPAYPYTNLEDAIRYAQLAYTEEDRHTFTPEAAAEHWDYKPTSSAVGQVVSALKQFGLLVEEPGNAIRHLRLSPLALDILIPEDETEPRRCQAIKTAALNPKMHREIWEKYGGKLPSDTSLKIYLLREREVKFNKDQVDGFISQLRSTIEFAKLTDSDKLVSAGDGPTEEEADKGKIDPPADRQQQRRRPMAQGTKEDVFTLEEGPVVLQYPEQLSKESFEDFESWIQLVVRKAKRSIKSEAPAEEYDD